MINLSAVRHDRFVEKNNKTEIKSAVGTKQGIQLRP